MGCAAGRKGIKKKEASKPKRQYTPHQTPLSAPAATSCIVDKQEKCYFLRFRSRGKPRSTCQQVLHLPRGYFLTKMTPPGHVSQSRKGGGLLGATFPRESHTCQFHLNPVLPPRPFSLMLSPWGLGWEERGGKGLSTVSGTWQTSRCRFERDTKFRT